MCFALRYEWRSLLIQAYLSVKTYGEAFHLDDYAKRNHQDESLTVSLRK
ncbi:MAG: hypothetical protein FWG91_11905 [Lachnospiraceae bacterium]|nr:hypothetical protein [Lachnospiraceae bacterium]